MKVALCLLSSFLVGYDHFGTLLLVNSFVDINLKKSNLLLKIYIIASSYSLIVVHLAECSQFKNLFAV